MSSEIAIRVENLGKMYRIYDRPVDRLKQMLLGQWNDRGFGREFWALQGLSCSVSRGEMIGVIGSNGSGKSTFLQMLAGTLEPTTGHISMNGRVSALLELGSGFNPEYSGRENVFIAGSILGIPLSEMRSRFDQIVDFSGINDFIDQPVKTYSSGMAVRLAFSVASSVNPEILIIDEALAVGDLIFQQKCYQRFDEIRKSGTAIVFVSHDLSAIIKHCDRAILLDRGSSIISGKPILVVDHFKQRCANEIVAGTNIEQSNPDKNDAPTLSWMANSQNTQSYGDGRAIIEGWELTNNKGQQVHKIASGEVISIRIRIRFNVPIESPIVGFGLRDIAGNDLAGTNTLYEKSDFGPCCLGDVIEIIFTLPVPLRTGALSLCIACTQISPKGLEVLHRLYDVHVFEILSDRRFVGVVDLRPSTTITRVKG